MKLYTIRGSRFGSRCVIQIRAKGLDVAIEELPYPLPASYSAVNPLGLVPVLEVAGRYIAESQVICEYLEDLGEGLSLRPEDPLEHAGMRLLIRLLDVHLNPVQLELYGLLTARPRDEAAIVSASARFEAMLQRIADQLDAGPYAVGGRLTLADCALLPPLQQARILQVAMGGSDLVERNAHVLGYFAATRPMPFLVDVLDEAEQQLRARFARRPGPAPAGGLERA